MYVTLSTIKNLKNITTILFNNQKHNSKSSITYEGGDYVYRPEDTYLVTVLELFYTKLLFYIILSGS